MMVFWVSVCESISVIKSLDNKTEKKTVKVELISWEILLN